MSSLTIPSAASGARVRSAVMQASADTGVDFRFLYNQARVESGLNPEAKSTTSSAAGLYQFTKQTWLQVVRAHGTDHGAGWAANAIAQSPSGLTIADPALASAVANLRYDPAFASAMAGAFASDNRNKLESDLDRTIEPVDLYLAHFLGAQGAHDFLVAHDANPGDAAAPLFPAAARANRSIFYDTSGAPRSLAEIRSRFADKLGSAVTPLAPVTKQPTHSKYVVNQASPRPPMEMLGFEALPNTPSLEVAARAYQRLAGLGS